jgi:hypothetical protein
MRPNLLPANLCSLHPWGSPQSLILRSVSRECVGNGLVARDEKRYLLRLDRFLLFRPENTLVVFRAIVKAGTRLRLKLTRLGAAPGHPCPGFTRPIYRPGE